MFTELLSSFMNSPQAQQATAALAAKGIAPDQIQDILGAAVPAAAESMHQQTAGNSEPALGIFNLFGGHAGMEFLTGAIEGLVKGDGLVGSLEDGGMGMIGGHIGEVIAQKTGVNQRVAGEIAAVITPFLCHFVHEKLSGHASVVAAHGHSPHHHHHRG